MRTVRVDFNARGRNGAVKASLRRADGPLAVGEKVVAVDVDEDLAYVAVVDEIESGGRVWLTVEWTASRPSWSSFESNHYLRAAASTAAKATASLGLTVGEESARVTATV